MSEAVARLDDLADGAMIRKTVGGREIAIARVGDQVFAFDAICPHRKGPLDSGDLAEFVVTCPWHGWQFDIRTGKSPINPGQVSCYPVEVREGTIFVSAQHR